MRGGCIVEEAFSRGREWCYGSDREGKDGASWICSLLGSTSLHISRVSILFT